MWIRTLQQAGADGQQQSPFIAPFPSVQLLLLDISLPELEQHCDEVLLVSDFIQLGEELHGIRQVPLGQPICPSLHTQQPFMNKKGCIMSHTETSFKLIFTPKIFQGCFRQCGPAVILTT